MTLTAPQVRALRAAAFKGGAMYAPVSRATGSFRRMCKQLAADGFLDVQMPFRIKPHGLKTLRRHLESHPRHCEADRLDIEKIDAMLQGATDSLDSATMAAGLNEALGGALATDSVIEAERDRQRNATPAPFTEAAALEAVRTLFDGTLGEVVSTTESPAANGPRFSFTFAGRADPIDAYLGDDWQTVIIETGNSFEVDLKPTWSGMLPAFLFSIENGTDEGRKIALQELNRLAAIADKVATPKPEAEAPAAVYVVRGEHFSNPGEVLKVFATEAAANAEAADLVNIMLKDTAAVMEITGDDPQEVAPFKFEATPDSWENLESRLRDYHGENECFVSVDRHPVETRD